MGAMVHDDPQWPYQAAGNVLLNVVDLIFIIDYIAGPGFLRFVL